MPISVVVRGLEACFCSPVFSNHNSKGCCLGEKLLGIHLQDKLDMFAGVALRLEVFVERFYQYLRLNIASVGAGRSWHRTDSGKSTTVCCSRILRRQDHVRYLSLWRSYPPASVNYCGPPYWSLRMPGSLKCFGFRTSVVIVIIYSVSQQKSCQYNRFNLRYSLTILDLIWESPSHCADPNVGSFYSNKNLPQYHSSMLKIDASAIGATPISTEITQ